MQKLGPEELRDLLEQPFVAVLATYRKDGSVLLSPVWHQWRDDGFDVVVGPNDIKLTHLRRDPRASVVVFEHDPPYRGLEVRGEVRLDPDGTEEAIRSMAVRYLGSDDGQAYADSLEDSGSVLVRLEPTETRGWDFADDWPAED